MRKFIIFAGILWICLYSIKSFAASYVYTTASEASSACEAKAAEDNANIYNTGLTFTCVLITQPSSGVLGQIKEKVVQASNGNVSYPNSFQWTDGEQYVEAPTDTPESCIEDGTNWDRTGQVCVAECSDGVLNSMCLLPNPIGELNYSDDGLGCDVDKPDFQGVFNGKAYCDSNMPEPATCPSGEMQHIVTDSSGSGAFVCGVPITSPDNAGAEETTTGQTSTDGDITTVVTTDEKTGNTITTTTNNITGATSSVQNYNGTDSETGGPCSNSSVFCVSTPDTEKGFCKDGGSLCKDVSEIKDSLKRDGSRTGKSGQFEVADANAAVVTAESDLTAGLDSIKGQISGYFDLTLSPGAMICGPGVQVLGKTLQICPAVLKDELVVIAQIVMLIAGLLSLMIIFR